jgi:hypothetical protein
MGPQTKTVCAFRNHVLKFVTFASPSRWTATVNLTSTVTDLGLNNRGSVLSAGRNFFSSAPRTGREAGHLYLVTKLRVRRFITSSWRGTEPKWNWRSHLKREKLVSKLASRRRSSSAAIRCTEAGCMLRNYSELWQGFRAGWDFPMLTYCVQNGNVYRCKSSSGFPVRPIRPEYTATNWKGGHYILN